MLLLLFKRFLGKAGLDASAPARGGETPESAVARIQGGDAELRDRFITAYQPFAAKAASRFCKRYIDPARDDEFSIALAAFNEAIDQYVEGAGRSFLGFAETVIRRRLIDYVRKEQRHSPSAPLSAFDAEGDEEQPANPAETRGALERYGRDREADERRLEIAEFGERLLDYGIRFAELVDAAPKHADSRLMLMRIGMRLARSQELYALLESKRQLPIRELLAVAPVSRKTLERNRKFLIAITLIYRGAYPFLQEYLNVPAEESEEGAGIE